MHVCKSLGVSPAAAMHAVWTSLPVVGIFRLLVSIVVNVRPFLSFLRSCVVAAFSPIKCAHLVPYIPHIAPGPSVSILLTCQQCGVLVSRS